ncbi:MAG TPA: helix-turn-helix transcriptional regulator [Rhodopila sp.]|nr:helix-turn-helix transcriptional regulator [Rhodopila sp.]
MQTASTGRLIAAYRRRRGLSQAALAGLVGRSESWLSQVERGLRTVDRLSVLLELAYVLHVDVEALTGVPGPPALTQPACPEPFGDVRRNMTRYDQILDRAGPATTKDQFRQALRQAHGDYQSARYTQVMGGLSALLVEAELRRVHCHDHLLHASAHVLVAKVATKCGVADVATLAADRAANSAALTDSAAAVGLAGYQMACALLQTGRHDEVETTAVRMAELVASRVDNQDPRSLSVAGELWLIAAIAAARRAERDAAWSHLTQASSLADRLGEDANHLWTAFGPTNVALHRVSVAVELGDAGEAVCLGQDLDEGCFPGSLLGRRAQVHLDLARAQASRRQDAEATLHLMEAERVAPQTIRHNAAAREVIREMLARANRTKTRTLSELAKRAAELE